MPGLMETLRWARLDQWMRQHGESCAACLFIVEDGPLTTGELYELGAEVEVDGGDVVAIFEDERDAYRAARKLLWKGLARFDGRWHATRGAHDYAAHYEDLTVG
jgi:hypothetical protein